MSTNEYGCVVIGSDDVIVRRGNHGLQVGDSEEVKANKAKRSTDLRIFSPVTDQSSDCDDTDH